MPVLYYKTQNFHQTLVACIIPLLCHMKAARGIANGKKNDFLLKITSPEYSNIISIFSQEML